MCKHQLKITVRKDGDPRISIAKFRKLSLFERLSSRLFGQAKKMMLLIPEDSVQSLEIKEVD